MKKNTFYTPDASCPLVIAHRGARGHAPENTLAAAALAHTTQADLWELDVNYTKDGQLVVMHDDTLVRTTDVEKHTELAHLTPFRVCDLTLEQIRSLNAGSHYAEKDPFGRIDAGEVDEASLHSFDSLTVPTLEEALKLTKHLGWRVNVEIKDHLQLIGHTTVTSAVLKMIERLDMVDQILLSSFQHEYLKEAHALLPRLATGALVEDNRPQDPVALCRELQVTAYHPDKNILAPGDLKALRQAGFAVNVWTVNEMEEAADLLEQGASGIITDFPQACLDMMRSRGFRQPLAG